MQRYLFIAIVFVIGYVAARYYPTWGQRFGLP